MDSVFNYVSGFFKGMTSLLLVLLSFGVMAEIIFGYLLILWSFGHKKVNTL